VITSGSDALPPSPARRLVYRCGAGLALLVLALLAALVAADPAQARPQLTSSTPEDGERLDGGTTMDATLRFDTELADSGTTVHLYTKAGERLEEGVPQISGSSVTVGLPALPVGDYELRYRVVAAGDDSTTTGRVEFTIGARRSLLAWLGNTTALLWTAAGVACLAVGFLIAGLVQYYRQRRT
jgi:methionine-rich copper-binding protein CopC